MFSIFPARSLSELSVAQKLDVHSWLKTNDRASVRGFSYPLNWRIFDYWDRLLVGADTFDLTLFEQRFQPLVPETLNHDLG